LGIWPAGYDPTVKAELSHEEKPSNAATVVKKKTPTTTITNKDNGGMSKFEVGATQLLR
jgi:hypothetical protein